MLRIPRLSQLCWAYQPRWFSNSSALLKKKSSQTASAASESPDSTSFNAGDMKKQLEQTLSYFSEKVKEAKANNTSTDRFQDLLVDLGHNVKAPLKTLATVAARGNKINIVAFDPKQVKRIQTAILTDLGMPAEPSKTDKQTLGVTIQQQTEERKAAAAKAIKEVFDNLRTNSGSSQSIANIRAKYLNPLKKLGQKGSGVSKDEVKRQTQEIEQIVKTYTAKLQDIYKQSN